ncbi:hypothetical protein [Alienimonas chondri]|uniref:Uncharacterized protein n=1 Tax=Alienimonas chondri TaxID=2681879 RepID=A0ABX1V8D3_9PLAN|nr:hypothetical protein [Alienimonas chondri]NNJ24266.1 hypothetical protein [Alienimonas chondri]
MIARRPRLIFAVAVTFAAVGVVPASGQDAEAASRERIKNLTAEERAALRDRHEAFLSLPDAERDRLRSLHARLEEDGPGGELNQSLDRLQAVLARLTPTERAAVESASTPEERVVMLRRVIDGYRTIPPPPERFSDWFDPAPGQRSPRDWPRKDLIEEELTALLADQSSLSRVTGDDPLERPRAERLFLVLDAVATPRGVQRPRPAEDWLQDSLLTQLDLRLSERGLPGLAAWMQGEGERGEFGMRFVRGQLVEIMASALREAWTERIGGPDGERLLDQLTAMPDRVAVRSAGGPARADLAEDLVRDERVSAEDLSMTDEERQTAARAFELANRLRDSVSGNRRFGGRRGGDRRPPERPRGPGPGDGPPSDGPPPNGPPRVRPSF